MGTVAGMRTQSEAGMTEREDLIARLLAAAEVRPEVANLLREAAEALSGTVPNRTQP